MNILEKSAFGVCSYIGDKIGISSGSTRLYFIYLSFATLGSPIILYLFFAFWLKNKYLFKKNNVLFN